MTRRVPISQIIVGKRHRQEMGDLDELVASIRSLGLLHPVVVTPNTVGYRLVAGARRLEAVKRMGMEDIPITVVTTLADAADLLRAERDENTCRLDPLPSEAVALGEQLEAIERPRAAERKGGRPPKETGGDSPPVSGPTGKVRDIVAPAVGMKPSRYAHAKSVVNAANNDPDPEVREIAEEAVKEMDETGSVEGPYRKVLAARNGDEEDDEQLGVKQRRAAERREQVLRLHRQGFSHPEIAEQLGISESTVQSDVNALGINRGRGARVSTTAQILTNISTQLSGLTLALTKIDLGDLTPDEDEAAQWLGDLDKAIRSLSQLRRQIKEKLH